MAKLHLGLLSFGIFLLIVALWIAAWVLAFITLDNLVPLILMSSGIWAVILAGIKFSRRDENDGAFSTFGWGMLFIVVGGSLYMINTGMNPVYIVVFVLALIGALAVAAALRSGRR